MVELFIDLFFYLLKFPSLCAFAFYGEMMHATVSWFSNEFWAPGTYNTSLFYKGVVFVGVLTQTNGRKSTYS